MQIRRAVAGDEEALEKIRRDAILGLASAALLVEQAEEWAAGAAPDRIVQAIREHEVWVAVTEVAIGWVEIDWNRIAALYVSPPFSQRGVGSKLLLRAEATIRSAGYTAARLEASQNALSFYLRRGYLQCDTRLSGGSYPMTKNVAALLNALLPPMDDNRQSEGQPNEAELVMLYDRNSRHG